MDPIQAQSTGSKLANRLHKAGSDLAEGTAKTAHGAAKTLVNAPLAAGEVAASAVVATTGGVVLASEAVGAGGAAAAGAAIGLGVDGVELSGKAAKAVGNASEAVGDATIRARQGSESLLGKTAATMSALVSKGFDTISKAFGAGVDAVSPSK